MFLFWLVFGLGLSVRGFSDRVVRVLCMAREHALSLGHGFITPAHVLYGLSRMSPSVALAILERLGVRLEQQTDAIVALAESCSSERPGKRPRLDAATCHLMKRAKVEAQALGRSAVGTEHLVLGLLAGSDPSGEYLRARGITVDQFREELRRASAGGL